MPRKGPIPKRVILPDPKYGNLKLSKFINNLMERGKKSTAEKIIYSALDEISNKAKRDPLEIFEEALDKVGPQVEVKSRRVGGATYQVPLEVKTARKMALAMRWLVNSAKNRSEKNICVVAHCSFLLAFMNDNITQKQLEEICETGIKHCFPYKMLL